MNIPAKRNLKLNRLEHEHVYFTPSSQVIWDYFGYMLRALPPLTKKQVNQKISDLVYGLHPRIPSAFETDSVHPEQDLVMPVWEYEELTQEFKYLKASHLTKCVDQICNLKKRTGRDVEKIERKKIMETVFKTFLGEYVAIRSIIKHDAINSNLKVAFIPCSLQTYQDYVKSKRLQTVLPPLQLPEPPLRNVNDIKQEEEQFEKTIRRYNKKILEIQALEKQINEAKSKGDSPLIGRLERQLAKLRGAFDKEFHRFDFFIDAPRAITTPSIRKSFVEKWIPLLVSYYSRRFKMGRVGVAQVIGVLFYQIGLGLKSKSGKPITIDQHARWTLKHMH